MSTDQEFVFSAPSTARPGGGPVRIRYPRHVPESPETTLRGGILATGAACRLEPAPS